jgi:hypothetical protein
MNFIANSPQIRLLVDNAYCGVAQPLLEEAYLVAVTAIASEPLYFTVHLESGALWQRLPIEALRHKPVVGQPLTTAELQPYSCLKGDIQLIEYTHLKLYEVYIPSLKLYGDYKFTVDVCGSGLASDPVQHKTHNFVALENGQFGAFPNNMLRFNDEYFTIKGEVPRYSRVNKVYKAGG